MSERFLTQEVECDSAKRIICRWVLVAAYLLLLGVLSIPYLAVDRFVRLLQNVEGNWLWFFYVGLMPPLGVEFDEEDVLLGWAILLGIMVAGQALLLIGTGTVNFCRPHGRLRLCMPATAASFLAAVLWIGNYSAMAELYDIRVTAFIPESYRNYYSHSFGIWWAIFILCWLFWGAAIWLCVRRWEWERYQVLRRLAGVLLAGSLLQLLATVPAHAIVSQRSGWLVGLGTSFGIATGVFVLVFSLGTAIMVLFLAPLYRREQRQQTVAMLARIE